MSKAKISGRFIITIHDTDEEFDDFVYGCSQFSINENRDTVVMSEADEEGDALVTELNVGKTITTIQALE